MPEDRSEIYRASVMYLVYAYKFSSIEPTLRERLEEFCGTDMAEVPMNLIPYPKEAEIARRLVTLQRYIEDHFEEAEKVLSDFDDMTELEFIEFYTKYRKEQHDVGNSGPDEADKKSGEKDSV